MAKPKVDFLTGMGTGFQILKTLADEVSSMGGDPESLRLILSKSDIRRSVAQILVHACKPAEASEPKQPESLLKLLGTIVLPGKTGKFEADETFFKKTGIVGKPAVKLLYG